MKNLKSKMSDFVVKSFLNDEATWINKISLIDSIGYFIFFTCLGILISIHFNIDKAIILKNLSNIISLICCIIFLICCTIIFISSKKKKQTFKDIIRETIHEDLNEQLDTKTKETLNKLIKNTCELYLIKSNTCTHTNLNEELSEDKLEFIYKDVKVKFDNSQKKIGPFWITFFLWLAVIIVGFIYL